MVLSRSPAVRRALCGLALLSAVPALLAAQPAAPGAAAGPVVVEGYRFEPQITLAKADLVLNGIGLRAVAWLKDYIAALYLPQKARTPADVLVQTGPKRLQLRMLLDVPAAEFAKAFDKGVGRNTPEAVQPALQQRMRRFDALINTLGTVKKGDLVTLDYLPGEGTVFVHNGAVLGTPIAGADFYEALLLVFIGEKPSDRELKAGLLGGPIG